LHPFLLFLLDQAFARAKSGNLPGTPGVVWFASLTRRARSEIFTPFGHGQTLPDCLECARTLFRILHGLRTIRIVLGRFASGDLPGGQEAYRLLCVPQKGTQ